MGTLAFQEEAIVKLLAQPSCIIGDDMGLGKTIEAIELDRRRREQTITTGRKRTLVVCPFSLLSSWETHFGDWQPGLSVFVIDHKDRAGFMKAVDEGTFDVYVMHWDSMRLMPQLRKYNWFHIIADEAHRVSNKDAQVTMHSKRLRWRFLTQLTGTPCTARPEQFWSLLNWANPTMFSSYWRFYNHHVVYVQHVKSDYGCSAILNGSKCGKDHKTPFKQIIGVAHENELLEAIKPFYVRRLKEQVWDEMPPKYYTTIKVRLGAQQRRVYDQMRNEMLAWIGENQDKPLAAPVAIVKLVRLIQLAAAYADVEWVKVNRRQEPGYWKEEIVQKVTLMEPSAKLDAVMEILSANPTRQFVIFSQSKQVINLLAARLEKAGISHAAFTGDTPQDDRGNIVAAFQNHQLRVFAGTIQAGGEGITLTAADTVIFIDRTWSPAKNRQAEDRLHRIGQKNAVQVIDIVAVDTVDGGRLQRIEQSWQYIKRLLGDPDVKKPEGAYI